MLKACAPVLTVLRPFTNFPVQWTVPWIRNDIRGVPVTSRRICLGFAIGASRRAEKYLADLSIGARFITIGRNVIYNAASMKRTLTSQREFRRLSHIASSSSSSSSFSASSPSSSPSSSPPPPLPFSRLQWAAGGCVARGRGVTGRKYTRRGKDEVDR